MNFVSPLPNFLSSLYLNWFFESTFEISPHHFKWYPERSANVFILLGLWKARFFSSHIQSVTKSGCINITEVQLFLHSADLNFISSSNHLLLFCSNHGKAPGLKDAGLIGHLSSMIYSTIQSKFGGKNDAQFFLFTLLATVTCIALIFHVLNVCSSY